MVLGRLSKLAVIGLSAGLLSSCAQVNLLSHYAKQSSNNPPVSDTAASTYKVGNPYKINGVWYYPQEDFAYDETGIASWYGPGFHGKQTANGEIFDQNAVTAAHKTLQMPSMARVTNLDNGRSIVVRINDRGPYAHNREIDLSKRAAQLLGFEKQGTARVRVQILGDESRVLAGKARNDSGQTSVAAAPRESVVSESLMGEVKPVLASVSAADLRAAKAVERVEALQNEHVDVLPISSKATYVQAGAFNMYDNALRMQARLSPYGSSNITEVVVNGRSVFRVRLGPISDISQADRLLEQIITTGVNDARLIVD